MTLYSEVKKKKSWQNTLPFPPVYYSKRTNEEDLDLAALCSREPRLTLLRNEFSEIGIRHSSEVMDQKQRHLVTTLEKDQSMTISSVSIQLVNALKSYFKKTWDSSHYHLVLCSGGLDSRIMSWILRDLREEMGRNWLGDIHFICHHPEGTIFKEAMKLQGWNQYEYSIHKETQNQSADYYDLGNWNDNPNAFCQIVLRFWDGVVPQHKEKETVLISGAAGGEILHYPLARKLGHLENRYNDLLQHMPAPHVNFARFYANWHDVLFPFISYDYLNIAFRIPHKLFIRQTPRGADKIRIAMLSRWKDNIPCHIGHQYNFTPSQSRIKYIKSHYLGSKFYRDFKHIDYVKNAAPWKYKKIKEYDTYLYSYAAMYEHVNN